MVTDSGEASFRCLFEGGPFPDFESLPSSKSSKWYLLFVTFNFPVIVAKEIPGLTSTGFSFVAKLGSIVMRSNLLTRGSFRLSSRLNVYIGTS